jgi:DNA-binding helix-hairpin-helix protein with protein kinase domain
MFLNMREREWKDEVGRRLSELEHRVFRTARKSDTTKAQQILLFNELGLLDVIYKLDTTNKNKAKLLSILLNCSEDNVKKDVASINKKDSSLKNSFNYKFLVETFKQVGLNDLKKSAETELDRLLRKEEKEKASK